MNPTSEDMKTHLVTNLGLVFGTNLFVSEMPPTPDRCVCLYDTGGFDPEYDYVYQRPTFMARVRGEKGAYQTAWALARSVMDTLSPLANVSFGGTRYVGVWANGDIFHLGYDENQRPLFSMNFRAHRTA